MAHDYTKTRATADRMIRKWGSTAVLRRQDAADRQCTAFITNFDPMERMGKLTNPLDRKALVSALAPDGTLLNPAPDEQKDRLIALDPSTGAETDNLHIFEPPDRVDPAGVVVLYQLAVRR
jgi:hypothetical protein